MPLKSRPLPPPDSSWEDFAWLGRQEAADRNRRLVALIAPLPVIFAAYDLMSVGGAVLATRLSINGGSLLFLGGLWLALRSKHGSRWVYELFFALCVTILAANSYSLGEVSPAPGRLAFHTLTILGLIAIALQWPWPWQLALGSIAAGLFVRAIPSGDPDFWFFTVALSGTSISCAVLSRMITGWRRRHFEMEAELLRGAELQATQTAQLRAKNAELNDLLSVLSHDLRAPLINLEGFAAELDGNMAGLDRYVTERRVTRADGVWVSFEPEAWAQRVADVAEALRFIRANVSKMGALVRGLLELSRLQARPAERQLVDLNAVVSDVLASFKYQIDEKRVEVRVGALPAVVGDPLGIAQVFANLIDNAVKYMNPEGQRRIEVGYEARAEGPMLFVADSGVGIRAADHDKIFRPFMRAAAGAVAGDGLGLAIVKKIVERNGGAVWVESEVGAGSTFCFTLPEPAPQSGGEADPAPADAVAA